MLLAPMVEIFCAIDDFCKHYEENKQLKLLPNSGVKKRDRKPCLSMSEIMTLLIFFHLSYYRTFKDFYVSCVLEDLTAYFHKAVIYGCFVALIPGVGAINILCFIKIKLTNGFILSGLNEACGVS